MKKIIPLICMLLSMHNIIAQDWLTDFTKAKQIALEKQKLIMLVFQGSDWCAPCMKLEKEVLNTDEFKAYASAHFVMVKADFPRRKKNKLSKEQEAHNKLLAEKFNNEGYFPLVVIMNDAEEVYGKLGYENVSVTDYIEKLENLKK